MIIHSNKPKGVQSSGSTINAFAPVLYNPPFCQTVHITVIHCTVLVLISRSLFKAFDLHILYISVSPLFVLYVSWPQTLFI